MVAEVAGGGEVGRAAVLVAAVAGDRGGRRRRRPRAAARSSASSAKVKTRALSARCSLSRDARADDDGGDGRVVEDPAGGDVRDRDAVLAGDLGRGRRGSPWNGPQPPAASMKRLYLARLQSGMLVRLGRAEPALGQEAAAERAVGEQPHAGLAAELGEGTGGAAVDQRERDLVAGQRDAVGERERQVGGVEVGDADGADQPLLAQAVRSRAARRARPGARSSTSGVAGGRCWRRRAGRGVPATPARTTSGVIGPGSGHHLVSASGRPPSPRASRRPAISSALP